MVVTCTGLRPQVGVGYAQRLNMQRVKPECQDQDQITKQNSKPFDQRCLQKVVLLSGSLLHSSLLLVTNTHSYSSLS